MSETQINEIKWTIHTTHPDMVKPARASLSEVVDPEIGMTIIFITHDIGLAYYVSDNVYIMEKGRFVEGGSADEVILTPRHPYTKRLINDVPKIYEEWDLSTV